MKRYDIEEDWADGYIADAYMLENQNGVYVKYEDIEPVINGLKEAIKELESWWKDQGNYGTSGYEDWIPKLKALVE